MSTARLRFSLRSVALAAAAVVCVPVALAQSGGFNQLSPRQQEALAPLKDKWTTLPADSQQKWLDVANKMPSMSPPERDRVRTRMGDWSRMSGEDRDRARSSFQEARQLPSEERQARWQAYQALPEEKRRELSEQARPAVPPPPRIGSDRPAARLDEQGGKSNIVAPSGGQGRPGATNTLPYAQANPPVHTQPGLPKIAASPGFVDRSTLQPQRGAQGAAVRNAPPASAQNNRPAKPSNKGK
jgi:hypothetical protein